MDLCHEIKMNFYCAHQLEISISKLLNLYGNKVDDVLLRLSLKEIGIESEKHAQYLELIGLSLGLFEKANCEEHLGSLWKDLEEMHLNLSKGVNMSPESFIDRQRWIEGAIGEETYQRLLLPLIEANIEQCRLNKDLADFVKSLLNKIIIEEKEHEELLIKLLKSKKFHKSVQN
ncbi:MAG: hypothetical protein QXK88_03265 [Desulfurococcaceae archaeon]